jgi:hypothetical protein
MRISSVLLPIFLAGSAAMAAEYTGPRPQKADTLYLLHADNLIELERVEAKSDSKKDDVTYSVPGAAAAAKTPLAEPIFIMKSDKITPESIELYKFDIKGGHRELTMAGQKRRRGGPHAYRLQVTQLERGLYKIEASETLENGEYGLSPSGSDSVFCFSEF